MTFHGKPRADAHIMEHVHESPAVMGGPLVLLAIGATISGFLLKPYFIGAHWPSFWNGSISTVPSARILGLLEHVPFGISVIALILAFLGVATAYLFYMVAPRVPGWLARTFRPIYAFLLNKWYFDEVYDAIFVRAAFAVARGFWKVGDATIIDGVPNGAAELASGSSQELVKVQNGSVAYYAFAMLIGLVLLVAISILFR